MLPNFRIFFIDIIIKIETNPCKYRIEVDSGNLRGYGDIGTTNDGGDAINNGGNSE